MDNIFISILNMSLTGAFVILVLCFARLILRKSPKIFLYCLWAVVGFRLLVPFSIESSFSLMPFNAETIAVNAALPMPTTTIADTSGFVSATTQIGGLEAAAPQIDDGSSAGVWLFVGSIVWISGVAVMLLHGAASLVIFKRRLRDAVNVESNIYEVNTLRTPFVIGFFSPRIYLPTNLSARERRYIILHEQAHIKRGDHIVKFFAYFILSLHWFNPLVWLGFRLLNTDMEMSCDERVLKTLGAGAEIKKDYSSALLSLACERRFIGGGLIAFSASHVGSRVRNVLSIKKQSYLAFGLSLALVLVLGAGFSVNRLSAEASGYYEQSRQVHADFATDYIAADTAGSSANYLVTNAADSAASYFSETGTTLTENTTSYYVQTQAHANSVTDNANAQPVFSEAARAVCWADARFVQADAGSTDTGTSGNVVETEPIQPNIAADSNVPAAIFLNYISNFGPSCNITSTNYLSAEAFQN